MRLRLLELQAEDAQVRKIRLKKQESGLELEQRTKKAWKKLIGYWITKAFHTYRKLFERS